MTATYRVAFPLALLLFSLAATLLGGCVVERDVSLFPVDAKAKSTGPIEARIVGHGNLHGTFDATLPDGETLKGNYSIVPGGSSGFGSIVTAAGVATTNGAAPDGR
jgi:hypothetical protein